MPTLRLYDLAPSPNNIKVRLALGYKKVAYERIAVDPADRTTVVAATGQPLTPAIEHGGVKLFDSAAILRYIDANLPGPRLFSADRETMKSIENWEMRGKTQVQPCVGRMFGQFFAPQPDPEECAAASQALHAATADIETRLASSKHLVGDAVTAADLSIAPFVAMGDLAHLAPLKAGTPHAFFQKHLDLGPGRERTREWARRMMAFDR
jgi:glutathione S-transferase